ncbi:type II toxin-antitoxin system RelE/ParE family toxin [Methylobacterium sp. CM6247]
MNVGDAVAILSFADDATEAVFHGRQPKGIPSSILSAARRKLRYLDAASTLDDLKQPPGNKLHPLLRDRAGTPLSGSTEPIVCVSSGPRQDRPRWRSSITTETTTSNVGHHRHATR